MLYVPSVTPLNGLKKYGATGDFVPSELLGSVITITPVLAVRTAVNVPLATVVLVNVSDTPPTVSVVFVAVEFAPLDVWRTRTVSLFTTVPENVVHAPALFLSHSPPEIVTVAAALIPVIVTGADVANVEVATPVWSVNVNAAGVVSVVPG